MDNQVKNQVKWTVKADEVKTSATIKTISIRELVDVLMGIKKTSIVQLQQTSVPDMNKTGNRFFGQVVKTNGLNCLTAYQYSRMVNNARSRELFKDLQQDIIDLVGQEAYDNFCGEMDKQLQKIAEKTTEIAPFISAGLPWGEYTTDIKTGEKSRCVIQNNPKTGQWKGIFGYYLQVAVINNARPVYRWSDTGQELSDDEVKELMEFIPPKTEGERQGLEKPFIIRSPRLEGFDYITINKVQYRLQK